MIDFTKYTLVELRAIGVVMDDLMREDEKMESWKFAAYVRSTAREAFRAESAAIDQQAREHEAAEAEKVNRIKEACVAGAPPAEAPAPANCILNNCGSQLLNCPVADPPAPPDMFGWVGDALDDLCASGEVIGND